MNALNTSKTVGTTSIVALPDRQGLNSKRNSFIITNTSTGGQVVTLSIGEPAVDGYGVVLYAGGSLSYTVQDKPPQEAIYAISNLAAGTIAIYEESE